MNRKLMMSAISAAALAFATSASAVVWTSKLEYEGTSGPAATPYGVVTIQDGLYAAGSDLSGPANTVKVSVTLTNPGSLFINTGGKHEPFLYNVVNAPQVEVINSADQNFYDGGRSDPAAFEATPFGMFTNKIGCCSDWIEGHNVVSGSHMVEQVTTEQVFVGYKFLGYKIEGYVTTGYEPKRDNQGNIVYRNGQIVYTNKPIYDYSQPIYNFSKPIYDKNQPIYETKQVTKQVEVLDYTYVPGHWGDENNGASNGIGGTLEFYLHDSAGLTFAGLNFEVDPDTGQLRYPLGSGNHFFSNGGGWWFTADIFDASTGGTYNVAAKDAFCTECITDTSTGPIPEPATWALMILGFGGAGALLRRQRRLAAA